MKKSRRDGALGLGCIVAGAVFLFDPFVGVFDLWPDIIGYLLILRGLRRLALLEGHFDEAIRLFRRLVLLAAIRILAIPFIFGLTSSSDQPVEQLLVVFTLAILDCVVLFPAWREIALGLTQLAFLHDGQAVLKSDAFGNSSTDRLLRRTLVFMTLREVMAVLPELTVLFSNQSGEDKWLRWSFLYGYVGLLRLFSVAIMLVFGIVWLVRVIRYAKAVRRDEPFLASLRLSLDGYMEAHPDLVRCRAVRRGLFLLGASAVLTIDFFVDGINVLPDAVAGICVLCAAVSMLKCVRMRYEPVMGVATAFLLIGTVATVRQSAILHGFVSGGVMDSDSYSPTRYAVLLENANRMLKDADARTDFYVACAILLLAQLCFILLLLVVRRMLSGVIDRYTGSPIGRESDPRLAGADEEIRGRLKRGVLIATVIGCVVAVFPVVYMFTLPRALGTVMEAFGPLNTVLDIVFAVAYIKALGDIRRQMDTRYLLA